MKPVKSSNLEAIGYDEATRVLSIKFKSGGTFKYAGVPPSVHEEFMKADSHGKFFHKHIRNKFLQPPEQPS